jgi:hypothetical protein
MENVIMINPIAGTSLKNSSSNSSKSSARKSTRVELEPDTVTLSHSTGDYTDEEDDDEAANSY